MHICVSRLTIIGSDNGLAPSRRQVIIWTNVRILLIGALVTNFTEILIQIYTFSFKKMHFKMSSWKCWPFCLCLNVSTLTLCQCTLAGPVYTGMPLECHWLTQCTLRYHWAAQRMFAGYTGTPLEKLSWNSPTLECHWRNLVESAPHWNATGITLTFAAYIGTPLEWLWQSTHAPTHS